MKYFSFNALQNASLLGVVLLGLSACNHEQEYSISITNLTHAQPISPPVAMLHNKNFSFWEIGESASEALEIMAEGGDGGELLKMRKNNPQYQAEAPLFAGSSIEFSLNTEHNNATHLSVAGMLVNTNDGFSGLNAIELEGIQPGQKRVYYARVYDAGTEFNSELPGSIPGPADGGEGFNVVRDDVTGVVTLHSGVVSADDQHAASTLSEADKFDNPALRIVVTALQ